MSFDACPVFLLAFFHFTDDVWGTEDSPEITAKLENADVYNVNIIFTNKNQPNNLIL